MKIRKANGFFIAIVFPLIILSFSCNRKNNFGDTVIMKWQDGKTAAVSLTFDDGSINQFRVALPILDSLEFPATFFIITGEIPGSKFKPEFIGRPAEKIIQETATIPTNKNNLFERASLVAYAPYKGLREYFTRAGELFESGKVIEACRLIDEAFAMVRNGKLKPVRVKNDNTTDKITWDSIKVIASRGHEFASHTVSHPYLSLLDEPNLKYELEKSRQEILEKLGPGHIFSAECPYGIENERVMKYAYKTYSALRNRMPEPYLAELDRSNDRNPGTIDKEYIQWQRGPLTATSMDLMKSWVDTCFMKDNIWLVLVFHGVEGIGWQPKSRSELLAYYGYLKSRENQLWIATFRDVTKYIRERMNAKLETTEGMGKLMITLTHNIDQEIYDLPLTLKTYLPKKSESVVIKQGVKILKNKLGEDKKGPYVLYQVNPNQGIVEMSFN